MPLAARLVLCFALGLPACGTASQRSHVDMPLAVDTLETGSLTLVFSRKAEGVIVSVDGVLVVEGATIKRLRIGKVATGYVELAIAADGVERQMRVWVESDRDTSIPIGAAPMPPKQSPWAGAALSILALLISRSVSTLLF